MAIAYNQPGHAYNAPDYTYNGTFTGPTGPTGPPALSGQTVTAASGCAHVITHGGGSQAVTPDSTPEVSSG